MEPHRAFLVDIGHWMRGLHRSVGCFVSVCRNRCGHGTKQEIAGGPSEVRYELAKERVRLFAQNRLIRRSSTVALSFEFGGDLADDGKLNFYEASRFLYGASRFVYTLEHFRNTGDVLQRINRRVDADFNIRAPQLGSWILDVLAGVAPIAGSSAAASALIEVN